MFRAPTDCVQWFTGISGNVYSYNFAGSQLLNAQSYNNCIRTEEGEAMPGLLRGSPASIIQMGSSLYTETGKV